MSENVADSPNYPQNVPDYMFFMIIKLDVDSEVNDNHYDTLSHPLILMQ